MTDQTMQSPHTPETEAASIWSLMVNVLVEPARTFSQLRQKPRWVVPFLVLLVAVVLASILMSPYVAEMQMDALRQNPNMTQEQQDAAVQFMKSPIFGAVTAISYLFFFMIVTFVGTGVLMLMGSVIFGGKASFVGVLSVTVLSFMPWLVGTIIKVPLILWKETIDIRTSLALLMPDRELTSPGVSLLNVVTDIFTIWWVVILVIGISVIYEFKDQKLPPLSWCRLVCWRLSLAG